MRTFNRHDLVWLKLDAVKQAQYAGPAPMEPLSALSLLHRWVLSGYPLIVARQDELPAHSLRVGLAEPAAWGKRRLSFVVNVDDVQTHGQGPAFETALPSLPPPWQTAARQLNSFLQSKKIPAQVYGSAAIQLLTGLPCLTNTSDIDVLFAPASWEEVQQLCACLHGLQSAHPEFKVDGEVLSPQGEAVQWRELLQAREQVLVKRNRGIELIGVSQYRLAFNNTLRTAA